MWVECQQCGKSFDDAQRTYYPCPEHPPTVGCTRYRDTVPPSNVDPVPIDLYPPESPHSFWNVVFAAFVAFVVLAAVAVFVLTLRRM